METKIEQHTETKSCIGMYLNAFDNDDDEEEDTDNVSGDTNSLIINNYSIQST